jgi:hypothetical protein
MYNRINPKTLNGLYHVRMQEIEYDLMLQEGIVIGSPSIGKWMIGKSYWTVLKWIERKGGRINKVNLEK